MGRALEADESDLLEVGVGKLLDKGRGRDTQRPGGGEEGGGSEGVGGDPRLLDVNG